ATGKVAARTPRDVAVNPKAPAPLPLNRPIGQSPTQNAQLQNDIQALRARGATDMRVNQQQVNINGERVGVNRPDLQYTMNGRRNYAEYDTPASNRGLPHKERIIANDPTAKVHLYDVP